MAKTKEKKTDNTIFIQIASYRDPQLIPTLKDMLSKAKNPENLRIGIAWQHNNEDSWDTLEEYKDDKRFKIIDINYKESKGVCWARHSVQQLYNGEKYTLQLDSHHRFAENWDETLINMVVDLQKKGFKKPLITAYIPSFDPDNDPGGRVNEPWKMTFDRFIPEGAIFFLPASFDPFDSKEQPLRGRFYSAHFAFSVGDFAVEVQHNPEYYFHGEEISIAVRAFTHGYDIFHPHKVVCWHEYTRKGRSKQWDDDKEWVNRNNESHRQNRVLFGMDGETGKINPKYGFGNVRSLDDYEKYAGICFRKRAIQQYVLDHKEPPNPKYETEDQWEKSLLNVFKHCIDIGYAQVPEKDYDFWCVAFHDENDETMYRQDANIDEINNYFKDPDGYCKVWRQFNTEKKPKYWVVWPHSVSKGWCERITGQL